MPTRKMPSKGSKPDKLMRDALMLALHREAKNADGQKTKKLNLVASKLVDLAVDGDIQAIKEINDRVDGKVSQAHEIGGADGGPIQVIVKQFTLPDAEA